jgi:hypothetical protein
VSAAPMVHSTNRRSGVNVGERPSVLWTVRFADMRIIDSLNGAVCIGNAEALRPFATAAHLVPRGSLLQTPTTMVHCAGRGADCDHFIQREVGWALRCCPLLPCGKQDGLFVAALGWGCVGVRLLVRPLPVGPNHAVRKSAAFERLVMLDALSLSAADGCVAWPLRHVYAACHVAGLRWCKRSGRRVPGCASADRRSRTSSACRTSISCPYGPHQANKEWAHVLKR